jgi:thiamine pyrophosphate-dependent acetolactate synthase large subunit-like protein
MDSSSGTQTCLNYWMEWHLPILAPRTFLYPIGSATLGYGVPAAIGAKVAQPDCPVVVVVGDGGLLFTGRSWPPPRSIVSRWCSS